MNCLVNIFFIFFALIFFTSQSIICEEPHVEAAKELISYESKFIVKETGIKIFSCGGAFLEKINKLALTVEVPRKICHSDPGLLDNARSCFIVLLKHFIDQTNALECIRPYLKNYPVTPENFDYCVILPAFDTLSTFENPKVALVFNLENRIVYCYRDANSKKLEPFFYESYDSALQTILDSKK